MQFVAPIPFQEALDKIGSRSPIGSRLSSSEWSDLPPALRERAYFSSRVESVRVLQRSRDAITDFIGGNTEEVAPGVTALKTGSRSAFVDQMQQFMKAEGIERTGGGLRDLASERRLGLIFDTQTRSAEDYGYWRQGMDQDVLDEFPAQRFIRVLPVHEPRQSHQQFEDQVYLKTSPIWARVINADFGVPWGPWGWGCGHDVEDVDRAEAEQLGLLQPGQPVKPDVKNFNENLQASIKQLDPDLIEKLKQEFGDKVKIEGDSISWNTSPKTTPNPAPTPAPAPTPVPTEPPPAPEPPAAEANVSPVSKALNPKMQGILREQVDTALKAIDQVHDDGVLPPIDVVSSRKGSLGYFQPVKTPLGMAADHIGVKAGGSWPSLSTAHEIGHFLDLEAIGAKGNFASRSGHSDMLAVLAAAEQSDQIKSFKAQRKSAVGARDRQELNYYLKPEEIWARAYAQYIAEKSGHPELLSSVAKVITEDPNRQWSKEQFAPIAAAIDKMFTNLGWL